MYIIYLLVLGQGCSALDGVGVDQIVSVPIPSLESISNIDLPKISPVTVKEAPEEKVVVEKVTPEIFEAPTIESIRPRQQLRVKEVVKKVERHLPEFQKPIAKSFEIKEAPIELKTLHSEKGIEDVSIAKKVNELKEHELSLNTEIQHFGFQVNSQVKAIAWSEFFGNGVEDELVAISERAELMKKANKASQVEEDTITSDEVTNKQASTVESNNVNNAYDPSDPKMLAMFNQQDINIEEIVKNKNIQKTQIDENKSPSGNDDLVLIDYDDEESPSMANQAPEDLTKLVSSPISSAVQNVIQREMRPSDRRVMDQLNSYGPGRSQAFKKLINEEVKKAKEDSKAVAKSKYKNRVTLYALEADLGGGFKGDVTNFNFIPSYNNNEVKEDFNEGSLNIDYSLNGETGILRGTLVKNYFIRTTLEIPLGSEYSKFEIPMITQDTLIEYLDSHNLEGAGGYYLVDLGEYLEDVDLEKNTKERLSIYEHRVLLDDEFKIVKEGQGYRYVLFIGVEPGNINVRYLGINGQETSKITFLAPDELTYDFSQLERPVDLNIETKLQNTLGKKPSNLDISPENIINFLSGEKASKTAPGKFVLRTPWKIKGSRSYFELAYLDDSIFVGLDSDTELELPSLEFISEVMRAFQMEGINSECLLQMNIQKPIRNILMSGESDRGPTAYDLSYLDEDGVFSSEISPLTRKLFVLGNEEGIYNVQVKYEDGSSDYLRTYCSPSTYLLEQL